MRINRKVYCDNCLVEPENIELANLKSINFGDKCKKCNKVLTIFTGADTINNDQNNTISSDLVQLPPKTMFFHMNKSLYSDARFENPALYSDKTILVIGSGSIKRTSVLNNLKRLKFKKAVYLVRKRNWAAEFFDDLIEAEHEDESMKEETLEAIKRYMEVHSLVFDAIFTYDDLCIVLTAYITTQLNLPGIPYDVAKNIKNKYEFRNYCSKLDISCPKFNLIKSNERKDQIENIKNMLNNNIHMMDEFLSNLSKFNWPIVIKNTFGLAKDFVRKCIDWKDLIVCLEESLKFPEIDLVVEEYFDGHEIDLDVLIQNNKAVFIGISDNFAPVEPYFFERGGMTPSKELNEKERNFIEKVAEDWVSRLNIQNACIHFEARCRPSSFYNRSYDDVKLSEFLMPIEINSRLGGAETWSMNTTAYGVNLFSELVDIALGIEVDQLFLKRSQKNPAYQCISSDYHPAKNVLINKIEIDPWGIQKDFGAIEFSIFRTVGETLTFHEYLGWVTVRSEYGSTTEEMKEKLESVMSYVHFDLKEVA